MMKDAGHLFVTSAGNDGCDVDAAVSTCPGVVLRPGGYDLDNILTVASSTRTGGISWFSNWGGLSVDVFAPGEDILAAWNTLAESGDYAFVSGTSFSSPLAAGLAALIWTANPHMDYLTVKNTILKTTTPQTQLKYASVTGGIIDAWAALADSEKVDNPQELMPPPTDDLTNYFYTAVSQSVSNEIYTITIGFLWLSLYL